MRVFAGAMNSPRVSDVVKEDALIGSLSFTALVSSLVAPTEKPDLQAKTTTMNQELNKSRAKSLEDYEERLAN